MSSLSIVSRQDRWSDLAERERHVEQRENTVLETFSDLEAQRDAIRAKMSELRGLVQTLDGYAPERDEIESGLIGVESVGEDLEQTYEPLLELRDEWLCKREELCGRVADDVSRMTERMGRAMALLDDLATRAKEARATDQAQTSPAELPSPRPEQPPLEPTMEVAAEAEPSNEVIDLEASVTQESEDNFWAGLDAESGVFVSTINLLPLGQRVHVRVDVEGSARVIAFGVVRWYRDWDDDQPNLHPGMGVELQNLDDAQRRIVEGFMSRRDPWLFV